jgi:hypothetical protein
MNAIYYDTKHPAGYSGAKNLARYFPASQVKNWLESQEPYTLHAPLRKRFQRNFYKVSKINDTFQADLCDMQKYAKENDNYKYILTVIDVFSKYAWTKPLKDKSAKSVAAAFEEILKNGTPDNLMTDSGKEFTNATMKALYKKYGINFYTARNPDIKASVCERFNRTLKTRMWRYFTHKNTNRYIDVLDDLTHAYNNSYHRSIKMAPSAVSQQNTKEVWHNLFGHKIRQKPKYKVGQYVRISKEKSIFAKGFERNYTREIFKITGVIKQNIPVYELEDLAGEKLDGHFYALELQKVKLPETYKINKILGVKGKGPNRQLKVSWVGYPDKFSSWIKASDLQ